MTAEELVDDADERLFSKVRYCAHHVLEDLLPPKSDSQPEVKVRRNAPELSSGTYHLSRLEFHHLHFLEIEFRH